MTSTMHAAVEIAQRMTATAPECREQPKSRVTPLRFTYGSKKRKAKRLASQAKGLYEVQANRISEPDKIVVWNVLAASPMRALALVNDWIRKNAGVYTDRTVVRICGVTAGTKERVL